MTTEAAPRRDTGERAGGPRFTALRHLAVAVAGGLALYVLTVSVGAFRDLQLAQISYLAIGTAGLTVLSGVCGQISLGHGALMAVGGYAAALLLEHQSWPMGVVLVLAGAVTAAVGVLVGLAAARLRGPYLAGATLGLAIGLPSLATYHGLRGVLGGGNGLAVVAPPAPLALGEAFPLERWQSWVAGLSLVVTLLLLANLMSSRIGRNMRLVREDETAASLSGVNVVGTRVLAFTVSAACAGLAGALFTYVNGLASPGSFPLSLSLALLTAAVLGGLGSLAGALYGSVLVTLLPVWLADVAESVHLSQPVYANLPLVAYGAVLIAVITLFPTGLQGALRSLVRRLPERRLRWPGGWARSETAPDTARDVGGPDPPSPSPLR